MADSFVHLHQHSVIEVCGSELLGPSPMVLPYYCVRCGEDAEDGKRFTTSLHASSLPYSRLGRLLAYARGRELTISYSLCRSCARHRLHRHFATGAAWALFAASFISIAFFSHRTRIFIAPLCLLLVASILTWLDNPAPIWARRYGNRVFTVKGAGEGFLARLRRSAL